jgi:predicted ATPase/DNA-binding XRE family transcriptional regulator
MKLGPPGSFGAKLKALREAAGYTQEELATIAGLSVHGISALERGERRRPHVETVRALSAALDLSGPTRDAFLASARGPAHATAVDELSHVSLPVPLTALLGRDTDVKALRESLGDPATRLTTLIGPGGVGKTRLALEVARAISDEGECRVLFVGLAAVRKSEFVAPAIAEALGVANDTAPDLPARARIACEGQATLLVLDNFEHVLDVSPLVTDLLIAVETLRVLATSRAPLRVRGEREYAVGPLALDVDVDMRSPADLARAPAVRLFVERARDVRPDFRLTASNGSTVSAICRRLDALPLALELAAPWIKALTVDELLRRLKHDVLLSTAGPRDLPERQQTMNATVAWSYQLLEPNEQRLFRRLGVLPGRFPIEAAAAVLAGRLESTAGSDEALRAAAGLIDKSLLRSDTSVASRPLYDMLETVRAYAALELTNVGERDDAMEGLVRYCISEASRAAEGLVGSAQVEWLDRVRDDLESYRSALAWLIDHDHPAEAIDIAWALMFFWLIRGHTAEGLRWYEQVLNLPCLPPADPRALLGAAVMLYAQAEYERSRIGATRALASAQSTGDMHMVAQAEHLFGHLEYAVGNLDAAGCRFARSVEVFRALAIPWGVGHALSGMAEVALAMGDADQAERLLDEASPTLQQTGPWFLSLGLYIRAIVALRRGSSDKVIAVVRESLTRIRELHDRFAFVYTLVPLAAAAVLKGDDAWAARVLGAREALMQRTGVAIVDIAVHDLGGQTERTARARLGPDRWSAAYEEGRRSSIDDLLKDIDCVV